MKEEQIIRLEALNKAMERSRFVHVTDRSMDKLLEEAEKIYKFLSTSSRRVAGKRGRR